MAAMSGGVDSAVAAALLLEQGYDVIGVVLKLWEGLEGEERQNAKTCCSLDDVNDARHTANVLGIPFYVLNFKDIFKGKVVDYFIDSYIKGFTPNPCIACNQFIKFDEMLNRVEAYGLDYLATGHYSKVEYIEQYGRYVLKKGMDLSKDQSYVLYMLKQDQLKRLLLPLGGLEKQEVRKIAEKYGFKVSDKPDSQDICFVEKGKYSDFIKSQSDQVIKPGYFVNINGDILGEHKGITNYTIGQRKGLGIAFGKQMFVIKKDIENNTVVLGSREETYCKSIIASDMNYMPFENLVKSIRIKAKARYSAPEADATLAPLPGGQASIIFDEPQPFAAPGQAVVMYDGDFLVGGGTIRDTKG